jgi:DUF3102 family protein
MDLSVQPIDPAILEQDAEKINRLHRSIVSSVDAAIEIGHILTEVRSKLAHGSWLPWLETNIEFSRQTADNYIRLFDNRDKLLNVGNLRLSEAYRLLAGESEKHTTNGSSARSPRLQSTDTPTLDELYSEFCSTWPRLFNGYLRHFGTENKDKVVTLIEKWLVDYKAEVKTYGS